MAKLAVFFFAIVAINAASARYDIKLFKQASTSDVERFDSKQGSDVDQYLMQLRIISKDVMDRVRDFTPTDNLYKKTLNWQCRVISQYFDTVIERLEKDVNFGRGVQTVMIKEFFQELREIQMTLREVDEFSFEQLGHTFTMTVQKYVEQIDKLVHFTQGSLAKTSKYILVDFITIVQNIDYQLTHFGHKEYTWVQLSMEIRELTGDLIKYIQDCYFNTVHVKQILCQFMYNFEILKNQHKLDTILLDNELSILFDQKFNRLYDIIAPLTQKTQYDRFVNTNALKREFITELEIICEDIFQYVQHFETKYQGTERSWIIEKILKNYLFTIYQLKTDLHPINQYYGEQVHESYGVRTEQTLELFAEIKRVIFDLTKILREDVTLVRQDVHVYAVEIRKMIFLVDRMVQKLRMQVRDLEGDCMELNQVIDTLYRTLMSLKRVIEYTTFTGMSQLMKELDQFLFTVVEQFHKLVMIDQEYRGRFDMDLTKVLEEFLMTLQKCKYLFRYGYEHESTYQYSGDYKYGKNYGYDYDYSYNMKPQIRDMDYKSYGYGKLYDFYYKPYETVNKKYDYESKTDLYNHEDKFTMDQLIEHIKIYTVKVVKHIETVIRDTDSKDVLVYQVRELYTILDQVIEDLEKFTRLSKHDGLYHVHINLKAIRSELYEIVHSGVIRTVYQIRSQFTSTIRRLTGILVKLVVVSTDYFNDSTFVYDVLYQYFQYLRNINMKWERNMENIDMFYHNNDFVTGTHGFTGKIFNY